MQSWQTYLLLFFICFIFVNVGLIIAYFYFLPNLLVKKIRHFVENTDESSLPKNYSDYENKVIIKKDCTYPSAFPLNQYDMYLPKDTTEPCPILVWVHGGFYLSGNKEQVQNLSTYIASNGVVVIAMNYAVAPENKYPSALTQINEITKHINQLDNNQIDLTKFYYGGDSAGGQLSAQFVALTCNPQLSKAMNIKPEIDFSQIKGGIFVCAPLGIGSLNNTDRKMQFLFSIFKRTYFGKLSRKKYKILNQVNISNHINNNFPPIFLTDGNNFSFEQQNRDFGMQLKNQNIKVKEVYFDSNYKKVNHEYIFKLADKEAIEGAEALIDFINETKNAHR